MTKFLSGLVLVLGTTALVSGCCKKGEDDFADLTVEGTSDPAPSSGATITGADALAKLKAKGHTPLTDPTIADNAGIKSTAVVLKPDMITVNVIEYPDESMAKMAHSASPSSDTILAHLAGVSVIRVVCAGKPKDKCEAIMDVIKQ